MNLPLDGTLEKLVDFKTVFFPRTDALQRLKKFNEIVISNTICLMFGSTSTPPANIKLICKKDYLNYIQCFSISLYVIVLTLYSYRDTHRRKSNMLQ